MKNLILLFLGIFFLINTSVLAQEKCYCDPVPGYFKEAGTISYGERYEYVPEGYDLWVRMEPAHQRNKKERGGCRLRPGDKYVTNNGKIIRVDKCGNPVVESRFIKHESYQVATTYNEPPCDGCNVDFTETHQKLDRLGEDHRNILYGQDQIYNMQLCSLNANLAVNQLITRYNTSGLLEFYGNRKANRELEALKQRFTCIDPNLTIDRANKLIRDGLDIVNVGLNVTQVVQNEQIKGRGVTIRNIDNFVQPDHNPNVNVPGHNENRQSVNQPGARMVVNKAYQN